jgi:hypothetical protein
VPFDIARFDLAAQLRCGRGLRSAIIGALSMESAAQRVCRFLFEELRAPDGERACALVRCYKTHPLSELPQELQAVARRALDEEEPRPNTKCLTLLASSGEEPAWNSRQRSRNHRVIPLASERMIERAPMIAQLIQQFGLELSHVVHPTSDVVRDLAGKKYGVFHVEEALGSVHIPAQEEFVVRHRVHSVVGFGGSLPSGDLFAVIFFSHVRVNAETAERFRSIALDLKGHFFTIDGKRTFEPAIPLVGDTHIPLPPATRIDS